MSKNPLFSTYKQGENRVTSSMLAVFERIDLSLLERLLAEASGESTLHMVAFVNQPAGHGSSVPDARISARFSYWFEVKTSPKALSEKQLQAHLGCLQPRGGDERLFVITPDGSVPTVITQLGDGRVVWVSFARISEAIDTALLDQRASVSEYTRFLLRELQALLVEEGLLDRDDVVVVAAKEAYPEYLEHSAYVCQPGRSFRAGLTHLGFYTSGAIQREVASILYNEDGVVFSLREAARRRAQGGDRDRQIASLIESLLESGSRQDGEPYQVFLLSGPTDTRTRKLSQPIKSDAKAASGKPSAWTQNQRYVRLDRLTNPGIRATSELAE